MIALLPLLKEPVLFLFTCQWGGCLLGNVHGYYDCITVGLYESFQVG